MRIVILRSIDAPAKREPFSTTMDTLYAGRFLSHFTNRDGSCGACADRCRKCRTEYPLDHAQNIAGVIEFPATLPVMLDEPEEFLPETVPDHDILIAIAVNEEILVGFIKRFTNAKGLIVPREGSDWISPHAMSRISDICGTQGTEVAFPKPFCAFNPGGGILREFRERFRIGSPQIEYRIEHGTIAEARVAISAPCGATYFTARGLEGKKPDERLGFFIDKQLSCFPCTADTAVDPEFRDSIMHRAVKIQRRVLEPLKKHTG